MVSSFSTGFLISERMVLTSSHNFIIFDQESGEVKEYYPEVFTLK